MSKKISETYKKLSQREHVLVRSETYVGSRYPLEQELWLVDDPEDLDNIKCIKKKITYTPAFVKCFDEVITNASDHYWRTKKVKYIKVSFDGKAFIVENDGGIPVQLHPTHNIYIPELIFGHLLAGSNFDDEEKRYGGGRNGLGAKLASIFSTKFVVETADGKKKYKQQFEKNMSVKRKAKITDCTQNYTKVKFYPDWEKFEMDGLDHDSLRLIMKRVLDVAAYCPKVKVYWNGKQLPIRNMKHWMEMHLEEGNDLVTDSFDENWEWGVARSPGNGFEQISIVNGISTHRGGTHVNKAAMEVSKAVYETLQKKHKKIKFRWEDVKNNLFLFLIAKIPNPTFDTQTKENLTNTITKDILTNDQVSKNTVYKISKTDICQSILDWIEAKELQNLRRQNKKLKNIKIPKLVDAKHKSRKGCKIFIFEGMSAMSAFRKFRDTQTMGAYPLRGKFMNVSDLSPTKVMQNQEAKDLMAAIGLSIGKPVDFDELRYEEILIAADQDPDGFSISALLINFFYKYWPSLFERGMVKKVNTPLIVAKNKDKVKYVYTDREMKKLEEDKLGMKGWKFEYKKGLASLEDREYKMMIDSPKTDQLKPDGKSEDNLDAWFGKDSKLRKEKLLDTNG